MNELHNPCFLGFYWRKLVLLVCLPPPFFLSVEIAVCCPRWDILASMSLLVFHSGNLQDGILLNFDWILNSIQQQIVLNCCRWWQWREWKCTFGNIILLVGGCNKVVMSMHLWACSRKCLILSSWLVIFRWLTKCGNGCRLHSWL